MNRLPPHLMNVYFAGQMLGFGTGLVLSALLLGLLGRRVGRQSGNSAKYHQAAMAILWNLGGLVATLLALTNDRHARYLALTAGLAHFVGAAFFPPAFIALWRKPGDERSARAKACKFLCGASTVSAVALTVAFIASLPPAGTWPTGEAIWNGRAGKLLAWHVAIVMGLGALLLLRGRLNDFVSRFYACATVIGAITPAIAMVAASPKAMSPFVLVVFCLLKEQSPLLILLGAIVFFSDFRFLNVYVKTSLQLLTGVAFALAFLLVMGHIKHLIGDATQYRDAAAVSVGTALLVFFLWCFVWVGPMLGRMVDRRLFGEPDYRAVLRDLWEQLNHRVSDQSIFEGNAEDSVQYHGADEQERVLDTVSTFVRQTLELEEAQVVLTSALDADHLEAALSTGEVYELSCHDPMKARVGEGVEFLAPIRVKGVPTCVITVSPGAMRRELLESEIRFLRAAAGQAGSRLEALQFEREKADRQNREERLRRQVTEAELRALRAQINPHFLFNSLNTIADLIVMDPAKADRMTVQLAKVFRHILSNSDRQMTTVGEELEFLRTYLDIEAARFGDRMRIHFDVDSNAEAESVPSLILQPVVENALKHGLGRKVGAGVLQVSVKREDGFLRLEVEDDGPGFSPSAATLTAPPPTDAAPAAIQTRVREARNNGVGLRNISERLATIYSGQAKMLFERGTGGGCRVTLLLPRPPLAVTM